MEQPTIRDNDSYENLEEEIIIIQKKTKLANKKKII